MIKEGAKYNIFNIDKNTHDLPSNISFTKTMCINNKNIYMCNELNEILNKWYE